jgi:uncharacterized protein involved in exopolysaccharide biosynthesis
MNREPESYSAYGVLNVLLTHARWFVIVPLLTAALAGAFTLLFGWGWVARSTFAPEQQSGSLSRLAGLAAQLGVNIPGIGESEASIDFYVRLGYSRVLLEDVLLHEYVFAANEQGADTLRGTLLDLWEIDGDTPSERLREGLEELEEQVRVAGDLSAGVVTIETEADWAGLAVQMNRRLLQGIDAFNQERRQRQASAERTFLDERLASSRAELRDAEAELSAFLQSNRQYENWPQLRFQKDRLQRVVDNTQQLVTSLTQAYEQARLEEVRNTPVIAVLDPPEGSAKRANSLRGNMAWGAAAGVLLVLFVAFGREYASRERQANPQDYEEFEARRRSLLRINGGGTRKRA